MKYNLKKGELGFVKLFCTIDVGQEIIREKKIPRVAIRFESVLYFLIFLFLIKSIIRSNAIVRIIGPSHNTNMSSLNSGFS